MSQQVDPNNVLKVWFYRLIKLVVFVTIILSFYTIYLDAWVQNKMSGPKWETPVKIFARPLTIYQKQFLPLTELVAELKQLNYQKSATLQKPGQFTVNKNRVEVYRREYMHIDGVVTAQRIAVDYSTPYVKNVFEYRQQQWQQVSIVSLEPLLISRQSSSNNEEREIIDFATVPEWMVDTLLTVEDKNFYHHHGVSATAIVRALWANLMAGRRVQGGSTLTQQLAKNLLLNDSRKTYFRKFKEAIVALILDYRFSKDDILEAYFNEIYLGQNGANGVHGFALASKFYFSKPLVELQPHEFALLVAIVKGPSYYNPRRYAQRAVERRDLVLQLMVSDNILNREEYAHHINQPMTIADKQSSSRSMFPAYVQLVQRELQHLSLEQDNEQGLLVFTGLDPILQQQYQKLFKQSVTKLEKQHKLKNINGAVISLNLEDASISALIGDKNPYAFGFNRALDSSRNIGSLIKPAVYLTALEQKSHHLMTPLSNQAITMKNKKGQLWQPQNYDQTTSEQVWLNEALVHSKNLPTVHLGMELGLNKVIAKLKQLGVEQKVPLYPSVLLGAISMSPLKVTEIFQPIASFGQKMDVSAIVSVTDSDGIVMWQKSKDAKQVSPYSSAYVLNYALNSVTREGTAKRLGMYYPKVQYAGKTGTTDDLRDSWFVGFDQNKLTTVWLGNDDNSPVELTGNQGALSTFIHLQAAKKAESLNVPKPNSVELRAFDINSGKVYPKECGEHIVLPIQAIKVGKQIACPSIFDVFK